MSSVYSTEPIVSGQVRFETTYGALDISLWCTECPKTVQFFLQLCMDGYYNNQIFHRIVQNPNLLIQTGAIRIINPNTTSSKSSNNQQQQQRKQTGQSFGNNKKVVTKSSNLSNEDYIQDDIFPSPDEQSDYFMKHCQISSVYERQRYEINDRIKFNHRGQVAMAIPIPDTNNINNPNQQPADLSILLPQFFITTAAAEHLNLQHVIFGTIGSSPTFFNAIRINEKTEIDPTTDTPIDYSIAPRILSVQVLSDQHSIFQKIIPYPKLLPWQEPNVSKRNEEEIKSNKKQKKEKRKLEISVLSFQDDVDIDESKGNFSNNKKQQKNPSVADSVMQESAAVTEIEKSTQFVDTCSAKNNNIEQLDTNLVHPTSNIPILEPLDDDNGINNNTPGVASINHENNSKNAGHIPTTIHHATTDRKDDTKTDNSSTTKMSALERRRAKYQTKATTKKPTKDRDERTMSQLESFQRRSKPSLFRTESDEEK